MDLHKTRAEALSAERDKFKAEADQARAEARRALHAARAVPPPHPVPRDAEEASKSLQRVGIGAEATPCGTVLPLPEIPKVLALADLPAKVVAYEEAVARLQEEPEALRKALEASDAGGRELRAGLEVQAVATRVAVDSKNRAERALVIEKRIGKLKVAGGIVLGYGIGRLLSR